MKQMAAAGTSRSSSRPTCPRRTRSTRCSTRVLAEYGRIDILSTTPGSRSRRTPTSSPLADFDKVLAVNLRGAFLCAQQAVRAFLDAGRRRRDHHVSSVHQVIPKPRFVGYSVSKGGMQNLTHSLALDTPRGESGSTASAPARPSHRSTGPGSTTRSSGLAVESHIPMRRAGDAEEMAARRRSLLRRGGVHHRADAVRQRRTHLVPLFETTWSIGVTPGGETGATALMDEAGVFERHQPRGSSAWLEPPTLLSLVDAVMRSGVRVARDVMLLDPSRVETATREAVPSSGSVSCNCSCRREAGPHAWPGLAEGEPHRPV